MCSQTVPEELSAEKIMVQIDKLLLNGLKPSKGLTLFKQCGWINYFPELQSLIGCDQESVWHPEGDVWHHTLNALDNAVQYRTGEVRKDRLLMYGLLCLNLGKPETSIQVNGQIRYPNHEKVGFHKAQRLLERISNDKRFIADVCKIVQMQQLPRHFYFGKVGDKAVKKLAKDLGNRLSIELLVNVVSACRLATGVTPSRTTPEEKLIKRARELGVNEEKEPEVLMGRDLRNLGMESGPHFSELLSEAYSIQISKGIRDKQTLIEQVLENRSE